nr:putative disease resistance protein RGA3 [Coffea arabica]
MAGALVDALLGSTTEVLVEKAINLASEQIRQFVDFKKDLEKLKNTLKLIQAVLCDAEKEQVTKELVKRWLENLERVAFDAGNLLDDINYEMIRRKVEIQNQMKRKSQTAPALPLPSEAGFMENRQTVSAAVGASFIGRDDDVSAIVTKLTATSNNETISVIPIVGMGGIGKTTVAQKVFNSLDIENHFDKRMWVCVSDFKKDFDANRLFGLMLESLEVPMPEVARKEAKVRKLKESLDGKEPNGKKPLKYLLVLDDVWNEEPAPWNRFLDSLRGISSAKGSWVIVTTRNKRVANITAFASRPCSLEKLSDDDCWLIISKNAFRDREAPGDLKELGLELAKKCQGLPLAASVLGGMLRNKERNEWQSILDTGLQNIGGDEDGDITKILKLSFDHLPSLSLKKCFAYCSIFPQDFQMERNQLIQLWAAEGFLHSKPRKEMCMEEVGNWYFTILLESNLFQDAEKDDYGNVLNCKMHDLVHDMVQSISNSKTLRLTESGSVDMETSSIRYLALERSEKEMPFPSTESFKHITTLFLQGNKSLNDREMSFFMLRVLN